jgi:sarcosine oxidase
VIASDRPGDSYDHIVVGAGIAGAATAYSLASRGRRVALLEQFELDHAFGSSHGHSRIFRLAYDRPVYVRLAQQARPLWLELEREAGIKLLDESGAVDCGHPDQLKPIADNLRACAAPTKNVTDRQVQFRLPAQWQVLYQADGGTSWARRALESLVRLARTRGAVVMEGTPVTGIAVETDSVAVIAGGETLTANTVVVAAGGWSSSLLGPLGIKVPLKVTRENVAYYDRTSDGTFLPFIWHSEGGIPELYGLPALADGTVKIGRHIAGREAQAGEPAEVITEEIDRVSSFVKDHLPGLNPEPVQAETCLYANSPDDDFIFEKVGRIIVGAGFGGHGFKFGPVIGELLADMAEGKLLSVDPRFSLQRFSASYA